MSDTCTSEIGTSFGPTPVPAPACRTRAWLAPSDRCTTCGAVDPDSGDCLRVLCGNCCVRRGALCGGGGGGGGRAHRIDARSRLTRAEAAKRHIDRTSACGKAHLAAALASLGGGPVRVIVIDFETSGFSARGGANVITQAAARTLACVDSDGRIRACSDAFSDVCLAPEVLTDPAVRSGVVYNYNRGHSLVSLDDVVCASLTERGLLARLLDAFRCEGGTSIVCAHNARFEREFVAERLARHGVNLQTWCVAERTNVLFIDTIDLFRHLDAPAARPGGRRPSMALGSLSRLLMPDAPTDNLHDAGADVQRTCDLLLAPEAYRSVELLTEELLLRAHGSLRRLRAAQFAFVANNALAQLCRETTMRRAKRTASAIDAPDGKRRCVQRDPGEADANGAAQQGGHPAGLQASAAD